MRSDDGPGLVAMLDGLAVPTPRSREVEARALEAEVKQQRARGGLVERSAVVEGWDGEHGRLSLALQGLVERAELEQFESADECRAWFRDEIFATLDRLAHEPPGCPARRF